MSQICSWLHIKMESLPLIKFPFKKEQLPMKGIYFFYEEGENADHGIGMKPRIVRIGTHRKDHFRSRMMEHFLNNQSKMNFGLNNPKPSDRSIFRKNLGRALLNKDKNNYLKKWEIDYTSKVNRLEKSLGRTIDLERQLESKITNILQNKFSFRYISFDDDSTRIGSKGMEQKLIGTVASCDICKPSTSWLGRYCPTKAIRYGKLWLSQGLQSPRLNASDMNVLDSIVNSS